MQVKALAKNFYWLNVTRFYCGCYSRGELASLADGLAELSQSPAMRVISYPRLLLSMLLSDWVFSQQPHLVRRIAGQLLEEPGFRIALANLDQSRSTSFIPPERSGREDILSKCKERLVDVCCPSDESFAIARLARNDLSSSELSRLWHQLRSSFGEIKGWLRLGRILGTLAHSSPEEFANFFAIDKDASVREFAFANRYDLIDANPEAFSVAVRSVLASSNGFEPDHSSPKTSTILAFGSALELGLYSIVARSDGPIGLESLISGGAPFSAIMDTLYPWQFPDPSGGRPLNESQERVVRFLEVHAEVSAMAASTWREELKPWSRLVEAGIDEFGMKPIFTDLALLAGGVTSRSEKGSYGEDIRDKSIPLCEKIRFVRLKSGAAQWWNEQFQRCPDPDYRYLLLTTLLYWATPRTIVQLGPLIEKELDALSGLRWTRLIERLRRTTAPSATSIDVSKVQSARLLVVLSLRASPETADDLLFTRLGRYKKDDPRVMEIVVESLIKRTSTDDKAWRNTLSLIQRGYEKGLRFERSSNRSKSELKHISLKVATEVCEKAEQFPLWLINAAQSKLTEAIGESVKPPGVISREQSWFVLN